MMKKTDSKNRSIIIADKAYQYSMRRSRRAKNILLHVDVSGDIEVVVPWGASYRQAEEFIRIKHDWLHKVLVRNERLRQGMLQVRFETGDVLPAFGKPYYLHATINPSQKRSRLLVHESSLLVSGACREDIRRAVLRWYSKESRRYFTRHATHFASCVHKTIHSIRITGARTQWGSCHTHKRQLSFNWKLALAPEPVARYVAAHEVAHLRVANHSPAFWRQVRALDPLYEKHRSWLREYGYALTM